MFISPVHGMHFNSAGKNDRIQYIEQPQLTFNFIETGIITMIPFRELGIDDRARCNELICASGCHGADYSFANLYIWRYAYDPLVYFTENRLLLYMPKHEIYAYPKGDGDIRDSVRMLLDDAHERGQKLFMRGLTQKTLAEFLPFYEESFEITEDRDSADYIYETDKLRYLRGRHLSSKRNHIRHFEKSGDWHFDRITPDKIELAQNFVNKFYKEKNDEGLAAEYRAINEMFTNFESLGFIAGMLYQRGEPVAFTAGTILDDETVDVHFEKALPGADGAYTMINREFVNMIAELYPDIRYFNREEDMGIEGLRRSKKSYRPDLLLMKYFAKEK